MGFAALEAVLFYCAVSCVILHTQIRNCSGLKQSLFRTPRYLNPVTSEIYLITMKCWLVIFHAATVHLQSQSLVRPTRQMSKFLLRGCV